MLILNYPGISNLYNRLHEASIISDQEAMLADKSQEELDRVKKEAQEYNTRRGKARNAPKQDEYQSLLNVNDDGIMGYIEIPKLHIYMVIYHGTGAVELEKGAGHMERTSLPIGGSDTHAVITGHRGLPSAELFTELDKMEEKDVFYLHILDETLAYEVDQIEVVLPDQVNEVEVVAGQDLVTLVTCTPYGINSHRLLVTGKRIPYEQKVTNKSQQVMQSVWQWLLEQKLLLISIIIILMIIIVSVGKAMRKIRRN